MGALDDTWPRRSNDALRAHGILPPKAPSRSPSPEPPDAAEARAARLKQATVEDLDEELDNIKAGAGGVDEADAEERRLLALRRRRLEELMREQKRGRFGRVYPIARQDYTREVTDASKEQADGAAETEEEEAPESREDMRGPTMVRDETGQERPARKGTGVVCFLYKDGCVRHGRRGARQSSSPRL